MSLNHNHLVVDSCQFFRDARVGSSMLMAVPTHQWTEQQLDDI